MLNYFNKTYLFKKKKLLKLVWIFVKDINNENIDEVELYEVELCERIEKINKNIFLNWWKEKTFKIEKIYGFWRFMKLF